MTQYTLRARRLEYGYQHPLFMPLDFACAKGEVCAILGANARGKTTLLLTLLGMLPVLAGDVSRTGGIGFVPQDFSATFSYRVFDIVLMGRAANVGLLQLPSAQDEAIARQSLDVLDIGMLANRTFQSLSGGQRQLVLIARALATRGDILILDEPTAALDLYHQQAVMRLIDRLAHRQGISILFTTHDPGHASLLADNTLLLLPQREWVYGPTAQVLNEENLLCAYGVAVKRVDVEHHGSRYPILVPLFDAHQPEA